MTKFGFMTAAAIVLGAACLGSPAQAATPMASPQHAATAAWTGQSDGSSVQLVRERGYGHGYYGNRYGHRGYGYGYHRYGNRGYGYDRRGYGGRHWGHGHR